MDLNINRAFFGALTTSMRHFIHLCHSEIEIVQFTEKLTNSGLSQLQTAKLCTLHISRVISLFENLISQDGTCSANRTACYDIDSILSGLSSRLVDLLSELHLKVEYQNKTSKTSSILVNHYHFELLLVNTLYCSVRNKNLNKKTKITLCVTENKEYVVFHIRDNCQNLDPQITNDAFHNFDQNLKNDTSGIATIILSLATADRSAAEMGGSVRYTPLKSGNRYDIFIPKAPPIDTQHVSSPVPYTPSHNLFRSFFTDVKAEIDLDQSDNQS